MLTVTVLVVTVGPQQGAADRACQLTGEWTLSWLDAGGAALGAAFGVWAGLSSRSAFGAALGALLGNLVAQGVRLQHRKMEAETSGKTLIHLINDRQNV